MNRMRRIVLLALAAAALPAALSAQPFRSDVTGVIPTGSGIAGMGYPVLPTRDIEGALFRQVSGRTAFRSRAIADAVLAEAAAAHQEACSGTLQRPRDWPDSTVFSAEAQRIVCGLLARPGMDTDDARRVLQALRACVPPGVAGDPAQELVRALAGLAALEPAYVDARQRYIAGERWEAAFAAYERFLDRAPDGVLDPTPPELLVIAAVLDRLVDAGLRAADR
ncbi:MAG TPA: hypothetical protein VF142_17705 [Longimicrobium sp.]